VSTAPDTARLLAALERERDVRGSFAIYEVVSVDDLAGVAAALGAHPRHPLASDVRAWLEARGAAPPVPDTAAQLQALGVEDPAAWVARHRAEVAALRRAVDEARSAALGAGRTASAYALMCVLLAVIAVAGWAAAFGRVPFEPEPLARPAPEAPPTRPEPR
jgi:hypothetical protein